MATTDDPYNLTPTAGANGLLQAAALPKTDAAVTGYTPEQATASTAASQGYTPKGVVVADDQTVAGNLNSIIAKDSPLMQQAETRARIASNNRGLLNSSIAVGAGQDAVIAAATPIATADAATRYNANVKTVDAQNAALNFTAQAGNQAALTNAGLATDVSKSNAGMINAAAGQTAQAANTLQLGYLDQATRLQLQTLDNTTKMALATLDAQNRQLLQTNQGAASMYSQTVQNIAGISQNTTMTQSAKDAAVRTQMALLQQGLEQQAGVASTVPAQVAALNLAQYFGDATIAEDPNAQSNFDAQAYLAANPDVAANATYQGNPYQHWLTYGQAEGRPFPSKNPPA